MHAVCFYEDELRELYNLIQTRKEAVLSYAIRTGMDYSELRALFAACEKIEKKYMEDDKDDTL